jgi:tetratricopeptide (TPR) repeat protein
MTRPLVIGPLGVEQSALCSFWEELQRRHKHDLPWESVAAGLLAMRVVDAHSDGVPVAADATRRIREQVEALSPEESTRTTLIALSDTGAFLRGEPADELIAAVFAYGRALEFEGAWALAVDVYDVCLRIPQLDAHPMLARLYIRLGRCYLCLESLSRASELIELGKEIAIAAENLEVELLAEMALCRMAALRGNLPQAERLADAVLARAQAPELRSIQSRAVHERATIAFYRSDYRTSVMLDLEALRLCLEPTEAWRIRSDMGGCLILLGLLDEARRITWSVVNRSPERSVRVGAQLNLLELEALAGDRDAFEVIRQGLLRAPLPPELATGLQHQLGRAFLVLGDVEHAREHLRRALTLATEFGFGAIIIEVDELLKQTHARARSRAVYSDEDVAQIRTALATL